MSAPVPALPPSIPACTDLPRLGLDYFRSFTHEIFGDHLHAKRVASLGNALAGAAQAAQASVHAIGAAYAALAGTQVKHGIKQVNRLLGNVAFDVERLQKPYVLHVLGQRTEALVSLDWTDFETDDQTTLVLMLVTTHGRSTPLLWHTTTKSDLEGRRTALEHDLVQRFHDLVPEHVRVTLLADRGFGDQQLYALLGVLGWDYVIRFRGNIVVEDAAGERRKANEWVRGATARKLVNVKVTGDRAEVPAVVVVHAKAMKEPWCLATSLREAAASAVVKLYGRRFAMEETFRDDKDLHFGQGLSASHLTTPARRDRMLFLLALARVLLTLLGAASEQTGLDKTLKASTTKKRTMSLWRQGQYWYHALPFMKDDRMTVLMSAFGLLVAAQPGVSEMLGIL